MAFATPTDPDHIRRLLEISRSISSVLELDRLLQRILNSAVEVAGAERGYLILLDGDDAQPLEQRLRIKAAFQMDMDEILDAKFRASRTAIIRVLESGQAHHSRNALEDDPSRSIEVFGLRSIFCEPLISRERLLGAIYLDSRVTARFAPEALTLMPSLAAQAAICIENATLVAQREDALKRQHTEHLHATEMETWKNAMAAFVSIASHDLKGPITVLQNGVAVLERLQVPDPGPEVLEDMRSALGRARRLVEMYLDAATLQEGRPLELTIKILDLHALVAEQLAIGASTLSPERQAQFEFVNAVPEGLTARGDQERTQQILANLIENAIKYARKGRIDVRAVAGPHQVTMSVCDQGPGIPEHLQANLFDRYFRAEPGVARGSGLGLWIVRNLVESQGGSISVQSRPGSGSCFRFSLPANVD